MIFHLKVKYIRHWKSKFKIKKKKREQLFLYLVLSTENEEQHNALPTYYLAVTKALKIFKTKEFLIIAPFGVSY